MSRLICQTSLIIEKNTDEKTTKFVKIGVILKPSTSEIVLNKKLP